MNYKVYVTSTAEHDLAGAVDYIKFALKNPTAASELIDLTEKKILALSKSPKLYPVVSDPLLSAWQIRFVNINNYLAFYTVDENQKAVYIIRFLFGKRDWISILKEGLDNGNI